MNDDIRRDVWAAYCRRMGPMAYDPERAEELTQRWAAAAGYICRQVRAITERGFDSPTSDLDWRRRMMAEFLGTNSIYGKIANVQTRATSRRILDRRYRTIRPGGKRP